MIAQTPFAQAGLITSATLSDQSQLSVGSLIGSTRSDTETAAHAKLQQAIATFQTGKYDEVLKQLEQAAGEHRKLPPTRLMLARMFLASGQNATARELLEQVAIEHPDYPGVYTSFGQMALREGRLTDALTQFEKAGNLTSGSSAQNATSFKADCLDGLAEVAERRRDWSAAETYLRELLAITPENGHAHHRLGIAKFHQGNTDGALAELQAGVARDKELPVPELVLSRLYEQADRQEDAGKWITRAVSTYPENYQVKTAHSLWLLRQGENEAALAAGKAAVKLAPRDRDARFAVGLSLRQLRQFSEAAAIFRELHDDSPADLEALNQLALCLVEHEDSSERRAGLQYAASLVRQAPKDRHAYATLGWAYYQNGNLPQARQALQTSISGGQGPAVAGYYLACVLRDLGEMDGIPNLLTAAERAREPFVYRREVKEWRQQLASNNEN